MKNRIQIEVTIDEFIGRKIKEARKEAELSQRELCERLSWFSLMALSHYECGRRSLTPTRLLKIAKELRKPIQWFLPK